MSASSFHGVTQSDAFDIHSDSIPSQNQRFATLVSLMLSSQTKDEVTDAAVGKLRTALGGSLSVLAMLEADDTVISDAIAKVGFWRRKTQCVWFLSPRCLFVHDDDRVRLRLRFVCLTFRYIKQTARRLHDDFDDDIPKTVDELCSLPGVGPKMAFLALQVAWKLYVFFFAPCDANDPSLTEYLRPTVETWASGSTSTYTGSRIG